jgi:hypothetical protein
MSMRFFEDPWTHHIELLFGIVDSATVEAVEVLGSDINQQVLQSLFGPLLFQAL